MAKYRKNNATIWSHWSRSRHRYKPDLFPSQDFFCRIVVILVLVVRVVLIQTILNVFAANDSPSNYD